MRWSEENKKKFRELYMAGVSYSDLSLEFGVTQAAISDFRRRAKLPPRKGTGKREAPADVEEVVAAVGIIGARKHYSVGWTTLNRWVKEIGIEVDKNKRYCGNQTRLVAVPEDWETIAPTMFKTELSRHYRISNKTVNKIIAQTGIDSKKILPKPKPEPKPQKPRSRVNWRLTNWRMFNYSSSGQLHTMATEAARYLRRLYSNVHRCDIQMYEGRATTWGDENGVPNRGKGWYRVGHLKMTEIEMINLAIAKGMDV